MSLIFIIITIKYCSCVLFHINLLIAFRDSKRTSNTENVIGKTFVITGATGSMQTLKIFQVKRDYKYFSTVKSYWL